MLQASVPADVKVSKTLSEVPNFEILIEGRINIAHMQLSRRLRLVIVPFAGVPEKTISILSRYPNIAVHNLHHNAADTAEMAIALLMAAAKLIVPIDAKLRRDDWTPRYEPSRSVLLNGKTAVILGLGSIGTRVAHACKALGMDVIGVNRSGEANSDFATVPLAQLDVVVPRAQVLVVAAPLTEETRGIITAQRLAALPKGAILVNIARAEIVEEEALYNALRGCHLHSAGLDVWYQYPSSTAGVPGYFSMPESASSTPPAHFPFGELENVVLSPHRGGNSMENESNRVAHLAALLEAAAVGREIPNRVDLTRGY